MNCKKGLDGGLRHALVVISIFLFFGLGFSSQGQQERRRIDGPQGAQRESDDIDRKRQEWFYNQRAYPLGLISNAARLRALEQVDQQAEEERNLAAPTAVSNPAWTLIGPQPTSRGLFEKTSGWTSAFVVDPRNPDVIYFGSPGGGVWKSLDGGAHSVPLTDTQKSLAIGSLALDPSNPDIVYAGTGYFLYGAGILKSTDAGSSWTNLPGPFAGPYGTNSFFDGGAHVISLAIQRTNSQTLLAGAFKWPLDSAGIYRSTDGGVTWSQTLSGGDGTTVFFDASNADVAYAAIGAYYSDQHNGLYKSTNAGLTWTTMNGTGPNMLSLAGSSAIYLSQAASNPTTMYVSITRASGGTIGLFKTVDGGLNWSQITMPPLSRGILITVHPANGSIVFAGAEFLSRSFDGGMTWTSIQGGANGKAIFGDIRSYAFSSGGGKLYVGDDGGQWSTNDAATSSLNWTNLNSTPAMTLFYPGLSIHPSNPSLTFGGSQDQGVQRYSGTLTWEKVVWCDGGWSAIDPTQTNIIYSACQGILIYKSTANGDWQSWTSAQSGIDTGDRVSFIPPLIMDPSNPQRLYFGTFRLYQTNNGAASWSAISPDLTKGGFDTLATVAVAPGDSNIVYVGSANGSLHMTTNANTGVGTTWTDRTNGLPNRSITQISVDSNDARIAYVTVSGFTFGGDTQGHVFKTTDSGVNWADISGNLPNIPCNDLVIDPDIPATFYLATDVGVFRTVNGGSMWSPLGTGLPRVLVMGLKLHRPSRILRAATDGRSMWDVRLANGSAFDFDADRKADLAVWRPSNGFWYMINSSTGVGRSQRWGNSTDKIVPGDYDGDGKTDLAIWRPSEGNWYIINSSTGAGTLRQWGVSTDIPVPGDYDGDGKTDFAVWRPSEGNWYIINSSTGTGTIRQWGVSTDIPVPGDYDGDGKTDFAVWRPSEGNWYVAFNNPAGGGILRQWGINTDVLVPGDYDGDGKTDFAVWRPSEGNWYVAFNRPSGGGMLRQWGVSTDLLVPGDYDGDGKIDFAVWRPSEGNWYIINSSTGAGQLRQWGLSSDVPVPSAFIR